MNIKQAIAFKPGLAGLMLLMAATRFHHFGTAFSLPDASLAVFFLAGFWQGGRYVLAVLLLEAGLIDYVAITQFSVSDFCISPAYVFLIPSYALLWLAGQYNGKLAITSLVNAAKAFAGLVIAVTGAVFISNTSFYLLSDQVASVSWSQYLSGFSLYYPSYLGAALFYTLSILGLVKLVKWLLMPARQAI